MSTRHKCTGLTEACLVSALADWFARKGYVVRLEVPNMGQSTDLVAMKGDDVTCLEAKLSNWKRALEQCKAHEAVADYIYIAVASRKIPPALEEAAKRAGYGLIRFCIRNREVEIAREPERNENIWPPQRQVWSRNLERVFSP